MHSSIDEAGRLTEEVSKLQVALQESNHRIANSLQAVLAVVRSTGTRLNGVQADLENALPGRIIAISSLHRLLSNSDSNETLAFGPYLEELADNLRSLWVVDERKRIEVFHEAPSLRADKAIHLGMIINELVTNAFKYAFEKGEEGRVGVGFSVRENEFTLIVANDGKGFDFATASIGTGSKLLSKLARHIDATLSYQAGNPGTIVVLRGPAASDEMSTPNDLAHR